MPISVIMDNERSCLGMYVRGHADNVEGGDSNSRRKLGVSYAGGRELAERND